MFGPLTIIATLLVSQLAAAQDGSSITSDLVKRQNSGSGPFIPGTSPGCPAHWPICGTSNTCYDPTQGDTCCPTGTYACPGGSYCLMDPYCCPNGLDPKVCASHFNITLPAAYGSGSSTATGSSSSTTGSSSSSSSNSGSGSGSSSSSGGTSGSSGSSSGSAGNGSSSNSNGSGSSSGSSGAGSSSASSGSGSSSGNTGSCSAGTAGSGSNNNSNNNNNGSGGGGGSTSSQVSQVSGINATTTGPNIPLFTGAANKPALVGSLGILLGSLSVLCLVL